MATPMLSFEPDLGGIMERFTSPLTVSIPIASLTVVSGPETNPRVKGLASFRLTIDGTTYEIPISVRRQIRSRNGGRVLWRANGNSGVFRYFRHAPPVFLGERPI